MGSEFVILVSVQNGLSPDLTALIDVLFFFPPCTGC